MSRVLRSLIRVCCLVLALAGTLVAVSVPADASPRAGAVCDLAPTVANGLAQTPPMGWNDWYTFKCNVNEQLVTQTADAMVAAGMRDAGYEYVNIDACWQA